MPFNTNELQGDPSTASKEKWNKISKLVFCKNKKGFRDTMFFINDKLYVDMCKKLDTDLEEYMTLGDLRDEQGNDDDESKPKRSEASQRNRDMFRNNTKGRASVMSIMISDFRNKKKKPKAKQQ